MHRHGTHPPCHGGKHLLELLHLLNRSNPVFSHETYSPKDPGRRLGTV